MIPLSDDVPTERTPAVTLLFIAANVLAFLWQVDVLALPDALASGRLMEYLAGRLGDTALRGGVVPFEILTFSDVYPRDLVPPPLTVFTAMFLHGGLVHVGSNMLFLWIFGNNVEDALGRGRFVLFYLACGVVAAVVQVVASAATGDLEVPMVGASGAIAGVLAAYMVLFPRARVTTLVVIVIFIRIIPVPAAFFIGLWFLLQVLSIFFGGNTGVALFAHVGGFVAGWLLVRLLGRRPTWRARRVSW
ncbi:rhomboid family intramembrane serine protease [Anaeromyxobacter sp. PSR-1]|uniref:rhomboid family intramembrane serine protease n=1 Tax=unclassified Anaeromyxobacter TaxID=2620896 RepID=UPI0005E02DFD|nr:rhomboid family intramembrane serine protease [Anaeromyxobacter sp. PSR-1]GAO03385.1 presenilins-associated rhomboid-like protein, mitochondrial [Anaeromyxobacter sp. PSR-1]